MEWRKRNYPTREPNQFRDSVDVALFEHDFEVFVDIYEAAEKGRTLSYDQASRQVRERKKNPEADWV